jgi:hypothetical protein
MIYSSFQQGAAKKYKITSQFYSGHLEDAERHDVSDRGVTRCSNTRARGRAVFILLVVYRFIRARSHMCVFSACLFICVCCGCACGPILCCCAPATPCRQPAERRLCVRVSCVCFRAHMFLSSCRTLLRPGIKRLYRRCCASADARGKYSLYCCPEAGMN